MNVSGTQKLWADPRIILSSTHRRVGARRYENALRELMIDREQAQEGLGRVTINTSMSKNYRMLRAYFVVREDLFLCHPKCRVVAYGETPFLPESLLLRSNAP